MYIVQYIDCIDGTSGARYICVQHILFISWLFAADAAAALPWNACLVFTLTTSTFPLNIFSSYVCLRSTWIIRKKLLSSNAASIYLSNGHVCRRYSNSNMQIDLTTSERKKTPHANRDATLEHISATWICDFILSQYAIHVLCRVDANGNGMIQRRITHLNVRFLSGSIYFNFIVSPSFCTGCDRYFALRSILVIDLLSCCPRSP